MSKYASEEASVKKGRDIMVVMGIRTQDVEDGGGGDDGGGSRRI